MVLVIPKIGFCCLGFIKVSRVAEIIFMACIDGNDHASNGGILPLLLILFISRDD